MAKSTDKHGKDTIPEPTGQSGFDSLKQAAGPTKDSGIWIREDGAICFGGGECIVLSKQPTGELDFEVDPTACGKETGKVVLSYLIDNLASRQPINIKVKPQA